MVVASVTGLWLGLDRNVKKSANGTEGSQAKHGEVAEIKPLSGEKKRQAGVNRDHEAEISDSLPSLKSSAGTNRLPLQVLADGDQPMDERVKQLQGMRGKSLSQEERDTALAFLAGKQVPENMSTGAMRWLADKLLTVLRLEEPLSDGLAAELGKVAFQPSTDPMVRDYIMEHLGHLWEQPESNFTISAAASEPVGTVKKGHPIRRSNGLGYP